MKIFLWYFALINLILLLVMGWDKFSARRDMRRVPEKTLFTLAIIGGATGGTLGMYAFRHKTRHRAFAIGFPLLAAVQCALLVYLAVKNGGG